MFDKTIDMPEEYVTEMRDRAMFRVARLRTPSDGFYIPGSDQSIKRYNEPGLYTAKEAKKEFGKLIPTVSLVRWILDEAFEMEQLRDKLRYLLPHRALPDDGDLMNFLGLTGGGYLLRSDFLGKSRFLSTVALGWYMIRKSSALSKDNKFKVRLLLL